MKLNLFRYKKIATIFLTFALFNTASGAENDITKDYPNLKEVIVIYKTHFDIGYSDLARNVVHKYRTEMLDHALVNIEKNSKSPKNEQFVWTIPGWPMEQILWKGQDPERRAAIEKAIKSNNLVLHALPYTTHTESIEIEELVRGMGYASNLSRKYGKPLPKDAKMTDVPSHTWFLPTMLKNAGIEFFHLGGNLVMEMPDVPELFWWEGPDGSRLLTMASQGYGTSPLPPKGWPYSAWLYVNQTGDNEGPPSPETVQQDLAIYNSSLPGVKVTIGKLSDFSDAINRYDNPEIPIVRGDMPDTWVHGVMCSPVSVALSRNLRPMIAAADNLQTLEKAWGVYLPDETATYRKAYEQSLMFGEHTWGYAAQHYRMPPYDNFEMTYKRGLPANLKELQVSWDEHDQYIKDAETLITKPLANEIYSLADNVSQDGARIVVYNPLPWSRSGMVMANLVYLKQARAVKDATTGEIIPIKTIGRSADDDDKKNIVMFNAIDIPPMGYRTYVIEENETGKTDILEANENTNTIESPYYKAVLDPSAGRIKSLVDKRTGKELIDQSAPQGFSSYLYERFGKKEVMDYLNAYVNPNYMKSHGPITDNMLIDDDSKYSSAISSNMNIAIEKSPIDISAVMVGEITTCGMPQTVTIRLTLYANQPYADFEVSVDKKPEGWPEAGWICMPFNIENPSYRIGRIGSIIDPMKDIILNSNFRQIWVNTGIAIYNEKGGVGICPIESPMISLGEPGAHKFDNSYYPEKPYLYMNLYNNQWTTNFREFWGGKISSRVRVWSFDKFDNESSIFTPSMEARTPLLSARSTAKQGKLPLSQSGVTLSRKGIAVTTFSENPDGEGKILRLWENSGKTSECEVTLPKGFNVNQVELVDLRGTSLGKKIAVKNSRFSIDIKAYGPATILIK